MTDGRRRARPDAGTRRPAKKSAAAPSRRTSTTGSTRSPSSRSTSGRAKLPGTRAGTPRPRSTKAANTRSARASTRSRSAAPRRAPRRVRPQRRITSYRTRLLVGLAITAVVVPVLLLGLYPTRPYLAQRTATHQAEQELSDLKNENAELVEQRDALMQVDEIERLAREEHNMIRPGEEPYTVLPPAPPPIELPEVWPFIGADTILNG